MNGIDIITRNYIFHHPFDKLTVFRQSRIEVQLSVIFHKPFRMLMINMVRSKFFIIRRSDTVRIQPRMELHPSCMRLFYHKLQRIPIRFRSFSGSACQETAPRLKLRVIEGIRARTHLKHDSIASRRFQFIKLVFQIFLSLSGCHLGILSLMHRMEPRAPELMFWIGGLHRSKSCQ